MGAKYQRVLLKLSGEALMGNLSYGIEPQVVQTIAQEIAEVIESGIQIAIVVGGGNIFRGLKAASGGMDRAILSLRLIQLLHCVRQRLGRM